MYVKQIAVMKGQAWNVVETLKTADHGPLELTRRPRVCVWDDLVDVPIAVPLRVPSAEMRRRQNYSRASVNHEEMDISAALSTPPQQSQSDLLMASPPLELANGNRFNISREASSADVRESEDSVRTPLSPATVHGASWNARAGGIASASLGDNKPNHKARMSYDETRSLRRPREQHESRQRRYSLSTRHSSNPILVGDDDLEGDLGYAANEDMDGNRKRVIVERLEMVKSKNPVFTWC
jgi:hypothetical protein